MSKGVAAHIDYDSMSWRRRNSKKRIAKSLHMEDSCASVKFTYKKLQDDDWGIKSYYSLSVLPCEVVIAVR